MTEPTETDVDATDLALDALAQRRHPGGDPALDALASFASHIDTRAKVLSGNHSAISQPRRAASTVLNGQRRPPRGPRLRRRLVALPAALVLAFLIGVPLSTSPGTPLYPIHRMIFQDGNLSPAENARLSLASADQALNQASAGSGPAREQDLKLARAHLTHARKQMAMVTDTATRAQLDATLSSLEQRARKLASEQGGHNPGDGHGTGPSTQGGNEERGPDGSGGPATNPGNDQPSPGGAPQPWRTSN